MPTKAQVRQAFRDALTNNPSNELLIRQLRRAWRDPVDVTEGLTEAHRYLQQTAPAAMPPEKFNWALAQIVPALPTMLPGPGNGTVRDVRQRLRALLTDATSPPWLKEICERKKRTMLVDTVADPNGPGGLRRTYDQQPSDPINALADAALPIISAAGSTAAQITAASAVVDKWSEITPDQPPPHTVPGP